MKLPDHARKVYQGGIFGVHEWEQEMFDGSFEIFERVSALPIVKLICVLDDGTILINQEEQPGKDSFLSLPGGRLELEETLEEGARRELLEETGYSADTLELIDTHHVGYRLDLDIHLYLAR
jgi:8-oxo-dGTP pyrophosphatase MutT (NUDIX family)